MDIVIDLTPIYEFLKLPPDIMLKRLFFVFGWIPIAIVFLWGAKEMWISYVKGKWGKMQKFVLLAIDIPRGNQQTPKAMENIFTYLAGGHQTFSLIEAYWEGQFQLSFSLEIVSIDGYTQFLIYTPEKFRDLVESAVYSQYPDAEITEVNDYTEGMPTKFPDEEYDIWGAEFIQQKNSAYPIKTYKDFEHQMGVPEEQFKDPMATLMDLYSSLRKGEQLWFQLILTPIGFDWPEIGDKEISKILGESYTGKGGLSGRIVDTITGWISSFSEMIYSIWGEVEEKKKEEEDRFKMLMLKPKEKKQVESIQEKVSKLGFEFKARFVYAAKKEVMNKPKAVNGFVGFIKQFTIMDLNGLKPDMDMTATTASYFFKEMRLNDRKNKIIRNYINRDSWAGKEPGIFNIEELASLWHFPLEAVVKAPLIQKAPGRKAGPPISLSFGEEPVREELFEAASDSGEIDTIFNESGEGKKAKDLLEEAEGRKSEQESIFEKGYAEKKGTPPDNLPVV